MDLIDFCQQSMGFASCSHLSLEPFCSSGPLTGMWVLVTWESSAGCESHPCSTAGGVHTFAKGLLSIPFGCCHPVFATQIPFCFFLSFLYYQRFSKIVPNPLKAKFLKIIFMRKMNIYSNVLVLCNFSGFLLTWNICSWTVGLL